MVENKNNKLAHSLKIRENCNNKILYFANKIECTLASTIFIECSNLEPKLIKRSQVSQNVPLENIHYRSAEIVS